MTLPKDPPPTSDALQATLLTLEQHAYTRLQSARDRALIVDPSPADIRRHLQANYTFAAPMGDVLRDKLRGAGWRIVNQTPLPLVCCSRDELEARPDALHSLVGRLVKRGRAWVSQVSLPDGRAAIRACITSYDATEADLDVLVAELEEASISE